MLNDDPDLDAMAEIDTPDDEGVDLDAEDYDSPELTVTIEGEEPDADDDAGVEETMDERGRKAIRATRDALKAAKARARDAEAKLAQIEAAAQPKPVELVKPDLAELGFNQDLYEQKLLEYGDELRARKDKQAVADAEAKKTRDAYDAKKAKYFDDRVKLGVDDDLQSVVTSKLTEAQQSVIIDACADPAKVIAALAKSPKALAEIADIKEIHKFSYRLAQIEGKITVTQKAPPPPETKLKGGPGASAALQSLEKMHAKARETGDYDAFHAEQRRRAGKS